MFNKTVEQLFNKEVKKAIKVSKETVAKQMVDLVGLEVVEKNVKARKEADQALIDSATKNVEVIKNNIKIKEAQIKAYEKCLKAEN